MTRTKDRLLLVEGESDRWFFEQVCTELSLAAQVQVAPPRDVGGKSNTKEGVRQHLPILLRQLRDGQLKRLAVVVDADFKAYNGFGYQETFTRIEKQLNEFGFTHATGAPQQRGITFKHSDGLADLGLWIMPDNRREGALEDFIAACVSQAEQLIFHHAQGVVADLQPRNLRKFSDAQVTKAEVASWLAWQRQPGRDLAFALTEDLLDRNSPAFSGFAEWLTRIYR